MLSSFENRHPLSARTATRRRRDLAPRPGGGYLATIQNEASDEDGTRVDHRETTLLDAHQARAFARATCAEQLAEIDANEELRR